MCVLRIARLPALQIGVYAVEFGNLFSCLDVRYIVLVSVNVTKCDI